MTTNILDVPVKAGETAGLPADLVKLYVPLWLRERIKQTAAVLLGSDSDEHLKRYLVEQVGGDYLVRVGAAKAHSAMVAEWIMDDKPTALEAFESLRRQWSQEEDDSSLGNPKLQPQAITDPVEQSFAFPAAVWEEVKDQSRRDLVTTDEVVAAALKDYFARRGAERVIEGGTGMVTEDWSEAYRRAATAALAEHVTTHGEFSVPIRMAVIPAGKLPVFVDERSVRYLRETCGIADVDADDWVGEYIGNEIHDSLGGEHDVGFGGIVCDLVEHHGPEESDGKRPAEEKEEIYEKCREVAFRFQQELKAESQQEAGASVERGEA